MEKIKPIIITDSETGDKYTLEFNKESAKFAEQRGFNREDIAVRPFIRIPELFFYAFRMHHKNVSREKTDKILDGIGGVPGLLNNTELMERLGQLYAEPYLALPTEEEKNSKYAVEL